MPVFSARRRQRRPRVRLKLLALVGAASAQTQLGNPSVSRFNLTSSNTAAFQLPVPAVSSRGQRTVYSITLNVCAPPSLSSSLALLDTQPVLFAATSGQPSRANPPASAAGSAIARGGFANVTLAIANGQAGNGVLIGVTAPDQPAGTWTFELAATTGPALHVLDAFPLLGLDDTDATSAMLTSATYFPTLASGTPDPDVLVMATSASLVPPQLSRSSCYLRTLNATAVGNPFVAPAVMNVSTTTRGVVTLSAREGAVGVARLQNEAGGLRTQYRIGGLTRATNYTVWGLDVATAIGPVRLFQPQYFRTKSSASDAGDRD